MDMFFVINVVIRSEKIEILATLSDDEKLYFNMNKIACIVGRDWVNGWIKKRASCRFGDIRNECDSITQYTWAIELDALMNLLNVLGPIASELYDTLKNGSVTQYILPSLKPEKVAENLSQLEFNHRPSTLTQLLITNNTVPPPPPPSIIDPRTSLINRMTLPVVVNMPSENYINAPSFNRQSYLGTPLILNQQHASSSSSSSPPPWIPTSNQQQQSELSLHHQQVPDPLINQQLLKPSNKLSKSSLLKNIPPLLVNQSVKLPLLVTPSHSIKMKSSLGVNFRSSPY